MSKLVIIVFILITLSAPHIYSYNILAIVSLPLKSHYTAFTKLFQALAVKGHNVTVLNNFPDENPAPNIRFVDLGGQKVVSNVMQTLEYYENFDSSYLHLYNFYRHISTPKVKQDCENLLTNKNAMELYKDNVTYDVIFVERFISDCAMAFAATFFDAPIIAVTSNVPLPWVYQSLGIRFDVAVDLFYFSYAGPETSFLRKLEAAFANMYLKTVLMWRQRSTISSVFDGYLPSYQLDVEEVIDKRMNMIFAYQHFSLTGAKVLAPQLLEIAGLHIGTPKDVTKELEAFLADAKYGAIYVSFGSNLKANTMSKKKLGQFLTAFKKMPYKVIWKWENASFPAEYDNIYTSAWFQQLDVLCHPKVRVFISHGGMLSISEAAHCGKPVLTIPFFGDQFSNSAAVRSVGLGKTMFFDRLNAENLEETVRELMSAEMQESAQRVSRQWHDRPQPVMDSAIYWTEYVARHGSAAPPSLPSKHTTWFESLLIDVYSVALGILLAFNLLLYAILKLLKLIVLKLIQMLFSNKIKKE